MSVQTIAANRPPVTDEDSATVAEDSGDSQIDVLTGDSDPEGDPFGVRLQQSQLRHLRTSTAAATALAENYVGVERA